MIAVDTLLLQRHRENNPIKVALVGAGASARMIALHLLIPVQGIRLVAIADRSLDNALQTFQEGGVSAVTKAATQGVLEDTINRGACAITDNATLFCESGMVDIIIDATCAP
jgi:predicted homoserine dehydrogenase-like protein